MASNRQTSCRPGNPGRWWFGGQPNHNHYIQPENHHAYRNNIRNELKHHGAEGNKEILNGYFRQVALNHICGAIQNYKLANKYLPKEKVIIDFCLEMGIS